MGKSSILSLKEECMMKKTGKRFLALLCVLALVFTGFAYPVSAAANSFEKTDNITQNMLNAALAQVGKEAKDFAYDGMPQGYSWCAFFICWVARASGASSAGLLPGSYWSCSTTGKPVYHAANKNTGKAYIFTDAGMTNCKKNITSAGMKNVVNLVGKRSSFTPRAGDLILFKWKNSTSGTWNHIGLVYSVSSSKVYYVDGNGNPTAVTKRSLSRTSSEIAAYVRLNTAGVEDPGGNPPPSGSVTFQNPTDSNYTSKAFVNNTNACVVTKVTKPSGWSVTKSGLILADSNKKVIKNYSEKVTNVSKPQTTYHIWWDIQKEIGVTLTPGTTYTYQFTVEAEGKTWTGPWRSFTTTGKAPVTTCKVTLNPEGGTVSPTSITVTKKQPYGTLPTPVREGYHFLGWYSTQSGGSLVTSSTIVTAAGDHTLYARWEEKPSFEVDIWFCYRDHQGAVIQDKLMKTVIIKEESPYQTFVCTPASGFKMDRGEGTGGVEVVSVLPDQGEVKILASGDGTLRVYFVPTEQPEEGCDGGSSCPTSRYWDVNQSAWYHEDVDFVVSQGYMNGTSNTQFSPDGKVTRAMFAQILWNMEGCPYGGSASFTDVPSGAWYAKAVNWAVSAGLISGYGGGKFGPSDPLTRQQAATLLQRYAAYKGVDTSAYASLAGFRDASAISSYARDPMAWAVAQGILSGTGDNRLAPGDTTTRVQIAAMLHRFSNLS